MHRQSKKAFTLSELLIALAILGVIATFAIPKVLQASQDNQNKAVVKEMAAMFSQAFQMYQLNHPITTSVSFLDLTPYINYIKLDTTSQIDDTYYVAGSRQCSVAAGQTCLHMANGGIVMYPNGETFGNNSATQAIRIFVDPDGKVTQPGGPIYGQGKSTELFIYMNGRITTHGSCAVGTSTGWHLPADYACPQPNNDPPYIRNWN